MTSSESSPGVFYPLLTSWDARVTGSYSVRKAIVSLSFGRLARAPDPIGGQRLTDEATSRR